MLHAFVLAKKSALCSGRLLELQETMKQNKVICNVESCLCFMLLLFLQKCLHCAAKLQKLPEESVKQKDGMK